MAKTVKVIAIPYLTAVLRKAAAQVYGVEEPDSPPFGPKGMGILKTMCPACRIEMAGCLLGLSDAIEQMGNKDE